MPINTTMNQLSTRGKPIQMELISGHLLFVDPIYFDEIAALGDELKNIPRSHPKTFIQEVEKRAFPYGGGTLLGFGQIQDEYKTYELDIHSITYYHRDKPDGQMIEARATDKSITFFGVDSASFLIIDLANFDALLPILRADDLFDMIGDPTNTYIDKINSVLGNRGWAFIVSPGMAMGFDFEGDGRYYIKDSEDNFETLYYSRDALDSAISLEDPEMLEAVILAGANVNVQLPNGWTALHTAMDGAIDGMIQNNRDSPYPEALEMIRILISHGADLDKKDQSGETALDSINTYCVNKESFDSLVSMFRSVIPDIDSKIQFQKPNKP